MSWHLDRCTLTSRKTGRAYRLYVPRWLLLRMLLRWHAYDKATAIREDGVWRER